MIQWLINLFKPSALTEWNRAADSMQMNGYDETDIYSQLGPRPDEEEK